MATENLGLPTDLQGIGNNAGDEILKAFKIIDAEVKALRDRVTALEEAASPP